MHSSAEKRDANQNKMETLSSFGREIKDWENTGKIAGQSPNNSTFYISDKGQYLGM
jgi:hypothetical protein